MGIAGVAEVLTETIEGDSQEPLKLELQAFLESVATGAPPLVSGREGAAALKLAYDVMARIAGMRLEHRWANWRREPFTALSPSHVSVYVKTP